MSSSARFAMTSLAFMFVVEQSQLVVGGCCSLFDRGEGFHQEWYLTDFNPRDGEIFQRAQGVYAPVRVRRNLALTDQVVFGAGRVCHMAPPLDDSMHPLSLIHISEPTRPY